MLWNLRSVLILSFMGISFLLLTATPSVTNPPSATTFSEGSPIQNQRVAICLAGDARTFSLPLVHQSILDRVVHPISRQYKTDLFFSIAIDDEARSLTHKMQELTNAIKQFNPVVTNIESAGIYNGHSRKVNQLHERFEWLRAPERCGPASEENIIRLPHTLYRASQCLDAISKYEQKSGVKYDWVYRLRPDIVMFDDIVTPDFLQDDVYYTNQGRTNVTLRMGKYWISNYGHGGYGAIADQMGISSRRVADIMLRAWNAVDDCELYHTGFVSLPEDTLRFWALKLNQPYAAIPLNWAIVRQDSGAHCKPLYYQHGISPNGKLADWKRLITDCYQFNLQKRHLFPLAGKAKKALEIERYRVRPPTDILTL